MFRGGCGKQLCRSPDHCGLIYSACNDIARGGVGERGGHSISKVVGVPVGAWAPYPFPDILLTPFRLNQDKNIPIIDKEKSTSSHNMTSSFTQTP